MNRRLRILTVLCGGVLVLTLLGATWRNNLIRAGMDSDGKHITVSGTNDFSVNKGTTITLGVVNTRRVRTVSKIISTSPYTPTGVTRNEQTIITSGTGVIDIKLPTSPSTLQATYSSGSLVTKLRIVNASGSVVHIEPLLARLCMGRATSLYTSASIPIGGVCEVESFPDTKRTPMRWLVSVSTGTLTLTP